MARNYKFWTATEKEEIVKEMIEKGIGQRTMKQKTGISEAQLWKWKNQYLEGGKVALENKRKPGNPMAKYLHRKELSKEEQLEFEIIEELTKFYNIKSLCEVMQITRSSYYKWLNNKNQIKQYQSNRKELIKIVTDIHSKKPSYGYRRINAMIKGEIGWVVSDLQILKCCKYLGI